MLDAAPDAELKNSLEQRIQLFWDIGLEIGHSIHTIDECMSEAAADIMVKTSLLEARFVSGNKQLFSALKERYNVAIDPCTFFPGENAGNASTPCQV